MSENNSESDAKKLATDKWIEQNVSGCLDSKSLILDPITSQQVVLVWGLAQLFLVKVEPLNYQQIIYLR